MHREDEEPPAAIWWQILACHPVLDQLLLGDFGTQCLWQARNACPSARITEVELSAAVASPVLLCTRRRTSPVAVRLQ